MRNNQRNSHYRIVHEVANAYRARAERKLYPSNDRSHDMILKYLLKHPASLRELGNPTGIYSPRYIINNDRQLRIFNKLPSQTFYRAYIRDFLHVRTDLSLNGIKVNDRFPMSNAGRRFNEIIRLVNIELAGWKSKLWVKIRYSKYIKNPIPNLSQLAHRDIIQIIPSNLALYGVNRYSAASINRVIITNCDFRSAGQSQGIFSSDGLIKFVSISNTIVDVEGAHRVTLGGVLQGDFFNVRDGSGKPIPVVLNPLRLGGGKLNIHILGFSAKCGYSYGPVRGQNIIDHRNQLQDRGLCLVNFDLNYFYHNYKRFLAMAGGKEFMATHNLVTHMLQCNRAVDINLEIERLLK